jgi:micrococcal nuclease
VRYVGMNTPERDEVCYSEATQANTIFVSGKTVRLVKDVSDRDVYGRLLRYVYVGDLLVNRALVEQGYAEAVLYDPDRAHYDEFVTLEKQAAAANRGCHPSGIFNDGSYTR